MDIKPLCQEQQYTKVNTFGSVIPTHHWIYYDKEIVPVTDINKIAKFQKKIVNGLNRKMSYGQKTSVKFFDNIMAYISSMDNDYEKFPYAACFYNKNAGENAKNKGQSPITATYSYLITGYDAVEFQNKFITPLKETDINDKKIRAKYFFNCLTFIKKKCNKFINKKNLELHAIFVNDDLVKLGLYPTTGENNPFVKTMYKK